MDILGIEKLIYLIFVITIVLVTLCSLASYLGKFHYLLELTCHLKIQYTFLSLLGILFFLWVSNSLWLLISLFCLTINLLEVIPFYISPDIIKYPSDRKIRFLQANVFYKNQQYERLISQVKEENSDLAIFIEVTDAWAEKLELLQKDYSYWMIHQEPQIAFDKNVNLGIAVYSKIPLKNTSIQDLGGGRKTVSTQIEIQGKTLSILATHPSWGIGKYGFNLRNKQLSEIANHITHQKSSIVVIGDLNITMWSPYYKELISNSGLYNARKGFGMIPTWPSFLPLLSIPIDHCLVSQDIRVVRTKSGKNIGSDHLPLITDLIITEN
ncbi:endonuclease/exonuclease/phosphatase family protein [Dapis sp. BLCC M229]|uniref:endonuclease/exonuclease/phosphatase family protein n=1 Tax=Dapis sp. BLCC M229 TaxID=3400188 RepID=UPI003CE95493